MPKISAPFDIQSSSPNFKRDQFETLEDMRACTTDDVDQGHVAYCKETKRHYTFNQKGVGKTDPSTGLWSLLNGSTDPITMSQYLNMDEHENTLYFIVDSRNVLTRIYYKDFLIAKKVSDGEFISVGFPAPIPMIFA